MIKLSVVIITYNEEKNIARCLTSIKEVADDIVVVDSYSTDETKNIALSYGARVIEHPFEGHIQQKNWAITQAMYPHILSLDADEVLDALLIKEINKIKDKWLFDGYKMNRLTNFCGQWIRHSGWYPDAKLRLWDSTKGFWQGVNPHDEYKMKPNTDVGKIKGDILHYSFSTRDQYHQQQRYFTEVAAKAFFERGKRVSVLKPYINSVFKLVRNYIFKLGFLDGANGWYICYYNAYYTYKKYQRLLELQKK